MFPCPTQVAFRTSENGKEIYGRLWRRAFADIAPMACLAFERRRLIKNHRIAVDYFDHTVALVAAESVMPALQRKLRPFVVVKRCGLPSLLDMAAGAGSFSSLDELPAVGILMAGLAVLWGTRESHVFLALRIFVTGSARGGAMLAF